MSRLVPAARAAHVLIAKAVCDRRRPVMERSCRIEEALNT
jgi:hypothetical protein